MNIENIKSRKESIVFVLAGLTVLYEEFSGIYDLIGIVNQYPNRGSFFERFFPDPLFIMVLSILAVVVMFIIYFKNE